MTARVTAYCDRGVMRNGEYVHVGAVATDRSVIAEGSRMTIDGLPGTYTSADTGGGVHGAHVDVWFPDCAAALRWGVQQRIITIIGRGN